ncbi:hypothetical protein [Thermovibrio sp.]
MGKIELYGEDGKLISSIPVPKELCSELLGLDEKELLLQVALMIGILVKNQNGLELSPAQVLESLSKVVVCGREVILKGGNPAR